MLHADNPADSALFERILDKVLDVQIARAKKFGFVPFTFDPDLHGKSPDKTVPGQSIRLAHHAAELSVKIETTRAPLSAKLRELARLHLGADGLARSLAEARARPAAATGQATPAGAGENAPRPKAEVKDLSKATTPAAHAQEIIRMVEAYRTFGEAAYLQAAEQQARLAYVQFCDATCPLPKATTDPNPLTAEGKPFGSYYFRGATLMHAFALLAEAQKRPRAPFSGGP